LVAGFVALVSGAALADVSTVVGMGLAVFVVSGTTIGVVGSAVGVGVVIDCDVAAVCGERPSFVKPIQPTAAITEMKIAPTTTRFHDDLGGASGSDDADTDKLDTCDEIARVLDAGVFGCQGSVAVCPP
jgi:hypothetical protein